MTPPKKDAEVLELIKSLPEELGQRLGDNDALEKLIYTVFYPGPVGYASKFLAIAIQRHLLGLSLKSALDLQAEYLDTLSPEERAEWWINKNRSEGERLG